MRIHRPITLLFAALVTLVAAGCPSPPSPDGPPTPSATPTIAPDGGSVGPRGVWKANGPHSKESEGCRQKWKCDCGAAKAGCFWRATSDTSTAGVCASDDGNFAACTRCMVLEPDPCSCELVCK